MRTLGRNPTEDEIMNIMNEIDVDHNGKLDFSEFTIMMRDKLSGEDMEQEIKQAFRYVLNPFACFKHFFEQVPNPVRMGISENTSPHFLGHVSVLGSYFLSLTKRMNSSQVIATFRSISR